MSHCFGVPQCRYHELNDCRRPNAWVEHLIQMGGQGFTRRELSRSYRARGVLTVAQKCQLTRENVTDRAKGASNIYQLLISLPERRHLDISLKVRRMMAELRREHDWELDWPHRTFVTVRRLQAVFSMLNRELFGGSIPAMHIAVSSVPNGYAMETTDTMRLTVNELSWHGVRKVYWVGNRLCGSMLEALIYTMLHEICHAIRHGRVVEADPHGPIWQELFRKVTGVTGGFVQYNRYPPAHYFISMGLPVPPEAVPPVAARPRDLVGLSR